MSRTALDGFPFGDAEREYLVSLLNRLRKVYYPKCWVFAAWEIIPFADAHAAGS